MSLNGCRQSTNRIVRTKLTTKNGQPIHVSGVRSLLPCSAGVDGTCKNGSFCTSDSAAGASAFHLPELRRGVPLNGRAPTAWKERTRDVSHRKRNTKNKSDTHLTHDMHQGVRPKIFSRLPITTRPVTCVLLPVRR